MRRRAHRLDGGALVRRRAHTPMHGALRAFEHAIAVLLIALCGAAALQSASVETAKKAPSGATSILAHAVFTISAVALKPAELLPRDLPAWDSRESRRPALSPRASLPDVEHSSAAAVDQRSHPGILRPFRHEPRMHAGDPPRA
jgi:hypothetical protein